MIREINMDKFLFFNIVITILNIFLIVYAYSLNFFPKKWRKKVNQGTIVGLALIFLTMFTGFLWVFYYYFLNKVHFWISLRAKLVQIRLGFTCLFNNTWTKLKVKLKLQMCWNCFVISELSFNYLVYSWYRKQKAESEWVR